MPWSTGLPGLSGSYDTYYGYHPAKAGELPKQAGLVRLPASEGRTVVDRARYVGRMGASVQNDRPGHVIFLNGTSSAGKTTLARAIQEESDEPYLYWGIDTLFSMVPEKWAGARGGPLSFEGFRYDRSEHDEDGRQLISIRYGDVGRRMLAAACASVAELALKGCNVVVDEMLLDPELLEDWLQALTDVEVHLVGVYCPVDVLEEREAARGNPAGLARGHLRTVHAHEARYDLKVDTSKAPAQELARTVLRAHSQAVAAGHFGGGPPLVNIPATEDR